MSFTKGECTWRLRLLFLIFVMTLMGESISAAGKIPEKSSHKRNTNEKGKWPTLTGEPTLIMAHRGEKVLLPEHTVGSYEFASIEGADFVEPDLVLTKDGFLVCFHDLTLKDGTNVASIPKFQTPEYKTDNFTGVIDEGMPPVTILDNWFIKDFNLTELKELKIIQKDTGIRPQVFNGFFSIPTFEEYLDTVHHKAFQLKKPIGIIPELKHPQFHNSIFNTTPNFMEEIFLQRISDYGYPLLKNETGNCKSVQDNNEAIECGHLIIQSFELSTIIFLADRTPTAERMMLIDIQLPYLTYDGLKRIAPYAQYYSLWKELLYTGILAEIEAEGAEYDKEEIESMGGFVPPGSLAKEIHSLGMKIGIYTIYDSREPSRRGCTGRPSCDPENKQMELYFYFDMGVDGMFVENVPEAREIRMQYQYEVIEKLSSSSSPPSVQLNILMLICCGLVLKNSIGLMNSN